MSHVPTDELGNVLKQGDMVHYTLPCTGVLAHVASIDDDKGIVMLMIPAPIKYDAEHRRLSSVLALKMPEESLIAMPSAPTLVRQ